MRNLTKDFGKDLKGENVQFLKCWLEHQHGRSFTNMTDVTLCEKLYITYDTKL